MEPSVKIFLLLQYVKLYVLASAISGNDRTKRLGLFIGDKHMERYRDNRGERQTGGEERDKDGEREIK